jgi:hypothetical protein
MRINWAKGFFRTWAVLACLWVLASGWREYTTYWSWHEYSSAGWAEKDDCWEQFAKWPDGKPLDWTDIFEPYVQSDVERKNSDADRWRETVRQKLRDCAAAKEAAKPLVQRASEYWPELRRSLQRILLPPMALLIAGFLFRWIAKGFRA